ncbi:MAG: hypothetical protein NBKEAIPA_01665 [Nitrospirae bacterium]|nr:hypothetical protein [Nitrospirota bacterium]
MRLSQRRGQLRHGLGLKDLPRREAEAGLSDPAHDLQAQDGIAAEFEKIVMDADPFPLQHVRPDRRHQRFNRITRGCIPGVTEIVGDRQGRAIHLAVRGARQALQVNESRRDHHLGQPRPERILPGFNRRRLATRRHDIGHQALLTRPVLAHDCDGILNT